MGLDRGAWRPGAAPTRVVSLSEWPSSAAVPFGSPETAGQLASLRGRRASVVLWGIRADHRQVVVKAGSYARMRAETRSRLRDAGIPVEATVFDIAPGPPSAGGRIVVVASAPEAEVSAALAPLLRAGITVHSVLTPAAVLQSLARLRVTAARSEAQSLEAFVAMEETAACIAILHEGVLFAARDLPWGFLDEASDFGSGRDRHDIAVRLADDFRTFCSECGLHATVAQVTLCGSMPDLRSVAAQLNACLDIDVEPLDSLFGIDETRLPIDAGEFRNAVAGMRIAWAAAADAKPALDLFRARRRRSVRSHLSRAAVVAGTAAGLASGWWIGAALSQRAPGAAKIIAAKPASADGGHSNGDARTSTGAAQILASRTIAAADGGLVEARNPPARMAWSETTGAHVETQAAIEAAGPLPVDGSLETILYGPDRSLAIVDGHIVQVGDVVRSARVVEITAKSVRFRDPRGNLRELSLSRRQ